MVERGRTMVRKMVECVRQKGNKDGGKRKKRVRRLVCERKKTIGTEGWLVEGGNK